MNLVGIFSRRNPDTLDTEAKAYHMDYILNFKDKIDVLIFMRGVAFGYSRTSTRFGRIFNTDR